MITHARSLRGLAPAIAVFAFGALLVAGMPWRCPLLAMTGIPCPTCGMTRAIRLALRGDFAAATRMHPLWFLVVPACIALGVGETVAFWRGGKWGTVIERRGVLWGSAALGIVLVATWIVRLAGNTR